MVHNFILFPFFQPDQACHMNRCSYICGANKDCNVGETCLNVRGRDYRYNFLYN